MERQLSLDLRTYSRTARRAADAYRGATASLADALERRCGGNWRECKDRLHGEQVIEDERLTEPGACSEAESVEERT